jgi:hypothetical protein
MAHLAQLFRQIETHSQKQTCENIVSFTETIIFKIVQDTVDTEAQKGEWK